MPAEAGKREWLVEPLGRQHDRVTVPLTQFSQPERLRHDWRLRERPEGRYVRVDQNTALLWHSVVFSFIETRLFKRLVQEYLTEEEYRKLQGALIENPETGEVIPGSGGVRLVAGSAAVTG